MNKRLTGISGLPLPADLPVSTASASLSSTVPTRPRSATRASLRSGPHIAMVRSGPAPKGGWSSALPQWIVHHPQELREGLTKWLCLAFGCGRQGRKRSWGGHRSRLLPEGGRTISCRTRSVEHRSAPFASVVQIAFDKKWTDLGRNPDRITHSRKRRVGPGTDLHAGERVPGSGDRSLSEPAAARVFSIDAEGFSEVEDGCRKRRSAGRATPPVSALREDRDGNLWVGTLGDGLIRYEARWSTREDEARRPPREILAASEKPQTFTSPSTLPDNV